MTRLCNFPLGNGKRCTQPVADDRPNCGRHKAAGAQIATDSVVMTSESDALQEQVNQTTAKAIELIDQLAAQLAHAWFPDATTVEFDWDIYGADSLGDLHYASTVSCIRDAQGNKLYECADDPHEDEFYMENEQLFECLDSLWYDRACLCEIIYRRQQNVLTIPPDCEALDEEQKKQMASDCWPSDIMKEREITPVVQTLMSTLEQMATQTVLERYPQGATVEFGSVWAYADSVGDMEYIPQVDSIKLPDGSVVYNSDDYDDDNSIDDSDPEMGTFVSKLSDIWDDHIRASEVALGGRPSVTLLVQRSGDGGLCAEAIRYLG
jgi:hypothetical protein